MVEAQTTNAPARLAALWLRRVAQDFPTDKALKTYLKEHPKADPKNHSVSDSGGSSSGEAKGEGKGEGESPDKLKTPEGRKKLFGRLKDGLKNGLGKAKAAIVGAIKTEIHEWGSAIKGIGKLVSGKSSWKDLSGDERRYLITETMHTVMMKGLSKAVFLAVPPLAGHAVKLALSTTAFRLIDRKLSAKFAADDPKAFDVDEYVAVVLEAVEQAVADLASGKIDDKVLTEALAKAKSEGAKKETANRIASRWIRTPRCPW